MAAPARILFGIRNEEQKLNTGTQARQTGTVKFFDEVKGWGFISPTSGGPDLFVHFRAIQTDGFKTLRQNQNVEFEVKTGPKGDFAENVVAI